MEDKILDSLLDERFLIQNELQEADFEATKIEEDFFENPLWCNQEKLKEIIKKIQKLRNILAGIDFKIKCKSLL